MMLKELVGFGQRLGGGGCLRSLAVVSCRGKPECGCIL